MAEPSDIDVLTLAARTVEAWNSGDLDAYLRLYTPAVVLDSTRTSGVYVEAHDAVRAYIEEWRASYEEIALAAEELADLGNGVALGVYLQSARPKGTTGSVSQREATIGVSEGGLVARLIVYPQSELAEARADAERLARERG